MEAIAWDYYNGLIRTDPIVFEIPTPTGGHYVHPGFALLGFHHPGGWTPFSIQNGGSQGVNLIRNDNAAIWRYQSDVGQGVPNARAVRDAEIGAMLQFFGINGQVQTVCAREGTLERAPGTGIVTNFSNIMIRAGNHTAILNANVTAYPGTQGFSGIEVRLLAAPTAEFPERLFDTFMAIDRQMITNDPEIENDKDGDGWPRQIDRDDNDPTIQ